MAHSRAMSQNEFVTLAVLQSIKAEMKKELLQQLRSELNEEIRSQVKAEVAGAISVRSAARRFIYAYITLTSLLASHARVMR